MCKHTGMLVVVEGIDGAGKSTLVKNLAHTLATQGNMVVVTKEPGGSALGKQLRHILQTQPTPIHPIAEYLLFAADRAQHINEVVKPALAQGAIVISDRMADSSLAYQGYGRGIDINYIRSINNWALQAIEPDIVFYVKISPEEAARRLAERISRTAFEKENISFVHRIINGFETIFASRKNVITLDGTQTPEHITALAYHSIYTRYQETCGHQHA